MADQNTLLHDRIEPSDETGYRLNFPMIAGIIALVGVIGAGIWVNRSDAEDQRIRLIPEVTETPERRDQGGALFGAVPTEPAPQREPQQDPRIAALEAELEELRHLMAAAAEQKPTEAADPSPAPESAMEAEALAALTQVSEKQQAALEALLKRLEDDRRAADRRQRELVARIQANRPVATAAQPSPASTGPTAHDQKLEEARMAEEARLAQPLSNSLGTGGTAASAAPGAGTGNAFLDAAAARPVETARAEQLDEVHRLVPQGRTIPAILETAISSELPGQLRARVSRDVWSADATTILIPKGSTLVGEYASDLSLGASRVLVAWNRVITTDQRSIMIGSRGTDALGRAGMTGNVQHHFGLKFEAAFFISIFTGISNIGSRTFNNSDTSSFGDGSSQFGDAASDPLEEYLSIPPTIWVNQGETFNVFVSRDLYL